MNTIKSCCLTFFLVMGTVLIAQNKVNGPIFSDTLLDISTPKITATYALEEVGLINTERSEFAPMLYDGKLIFAATGLEKKGQPTSDLYQSKFEKNLGYYVSAAPFGGKLNSKEAESTTTFSKDGSTVYFTRHNGKTASIYSSTKKNGKWSKPKELPFSSKKYSVAHPSLNTDNTRLYFTSDMPGTLGATDIWYVKIGRSNNYSKPVNLGKTINTAGTETHPYISNEGVLYFASDTHPGLGGLDIFEAALNETNDEIVTISNLKAPINSVSDDYSLVINTQSQIGFFTSNRASGRGANDIYKFSKKEVCYATTSGLILEKQSNQALAGVRVQLLDSSNAALENTVTDYTGKYRFEATLCDTRYTIRASKAAYEASQITINTSNASSDTNLYLRNTIGNVTLGADLAKTLRLNAISFGVDRFTIEETTARELDKVIAFMIENPSIAIDVRSHTDSRSRDSYNKQLSNKRNAATIAYLIEQGVNKRRVTGKGYGETQPLNRCTNGVKCSEEEHQVNRRSEFIVVRM